MLKLIVEDYKIVATSEPAGTVVDSNVNSIQIIGRFSRQSVVMCRVKDRASAPPFLLVFKEMMGDNSVFEGLIIVDDKTIDASLKDKLCFEFLVNGILLEGNQPFVCNKAALTQNKAAREEVYKVLLNKVVNLEVRMNALSRDHVQVKPKDAVQKGMIPVMLDSEGNFMWDYPLLDIEKRVNDMVNILYPLVTKVEEVFEKVTKVEAMILDHINEANTL